MIKIFSFIISAIFFLVLCLCLILITSLRAEAGTALDVAVKRYFDNYYKDLSKAGAAKSKETVIDELGTILGFEKMSDIEDLNVHLNSHLNNEGKHINIFSLPGEDKVQCWLGEIIEETSGRETIWGRQIQYILRKIDNLTVHDYKYFSSKGTDALDAGVKGNNIYYNLEAYRARAKEKWETFFRANEKGLAGKPYDSLRYNRLRRKLRDISWYPLYLKSVTYPSDTIVPDEKFISESMRLMIRASLFHELGHIYYSLTNNIEDDVDSEIAAFLTELRYGPMPYESLDRVVSAAYSSSMETYKSAGREILTAFIFYISGQHAKKNRDYKMVPIRGKTLGRKIGGLYKLTEEQIRAISEHIYKKKYQRKEAGVENGQ